VRAMASPAIAVRNASKSFGHLDALADVSMDAYAGEVTCLLGDNGAGKSTLIQILSGVYSPDAGEVQIEARPVRFSSPQDAFDAGVSTVYQDLATIPLMSIVRNFFIGREPLKRVGPVRRVDWRRAEDIARTELARVGVELRDNTQAVGTLSGGERQSLAIARALHFGANVLVLDEPTSALGVREAANVLRLIKEIRDAGVAVIFITHNVAHAYAVGDRFVVLHLGRLVGEYPRESVDRLQLESLMAGGTEVADLVDA
jgi:simple sugar transport system ATP-binding protein